jgi:hypothetical protein
MNRRGIAVSSFLSSALAATSGADQSFPQPLTVLSLSIPGELALSLTSGNLPQTTRARDQRNPLATR